MFESNHRARGRFYTCTPFCKFSYIIMHFDNVIVWISLNVASFINKLKIVVSWSLATWLGKWKNSVLFQIIFYILIQNNCTPKGSEVDFSPLSLM